MSINDLIIDKIGRNKIAHISVSMNIMLTVSLLFNNLLLGITLSFAIGVVKETSDHFEDNNIFSKKDILFNSIGIFLGLIILLT